MIQLNLLPDIKAEYVKAQQTKHLVSVIAVAVVAVSLIFVGLLSSIAFGAQKIQLTNTQESINEGVARLQDIKDLDKILTIQNQLVNLTEIHDKKPVASRLFEYLQQTTPPEIKLSSYSIDYSQGTIDVDGRADNFSSINRYVDVLKFTEYYDETNSEQAASRAFSEVVLASFSASATEASFSIDLKFESVLFESQATALKLRVPETTTTRSQTQIPTEIFVEEALDDEL